MSERYLFKDRTFSKYFGEASRTGTLEVTVDWESLIDALGRKAAFNRSRKSGIGIGIKAKFIEKGAS